MMYLKFQVKATVDSVLSNGLKLNLSGGIVGYIHTDFLKDMDDVLEDYTAGAEVEARVLYLTPTVSTVMMTLKDVRAKNMFGGITAGQLVENAVIDKVIITPSQILLIKAKLFYLLVKV